MFNLLPQQDQEGLLKEYRLRFAAIALCFLAVLIVLSIAALAPSLFLSYQKEAVTIENDEILKKEIALRSKDDLSGVLKISEAKALALEGSASSTPVYTLIDGLIHDKAATITITGIDAKRGAGGRYEITVKGKAQDRDALLSFAQILEREKFFPDVSVPVSNFADAANINFSMLIQAL